MVFVCPNGWLCDDRIRYVSMKLSFSTRQVAHILGCLSIDCCLLMKTPCPYGGETRGH